MPASLFQTIAKRAGFHCEYCKFPAAYSPTSFVLEHIIPHSKGGQTASFNLAFSCQGCNNFKYNFTHAIDPATGQSVPLFNPRTDDWDTHFFWNEDFTLILGQTAIGRATVGRLKLNRPELVNIRKALALLGEHPPFGQ